MTDAEKIAASLSEAQRQEILACWPRGKHARTGEPCSYRTYARREATADVLVRLGLSYRERSGMGHRVIDLTPLGLSVRAIIQGETA